MKIALYVILIVIALALFGARYSGLLEKIRIGEGNEKGYTVVGLEFIGPYKQIGPEMEKVTKTLKDLNVQSKLGFGIYYNDPKTTPKEQLRSYVGSIVEVEDLDKLDILKEAGLKIDTIPASKIVTTQVPIHSQLSYMTGAMKAYPAMNKYIAEKGYEVTFPPYEIYDEVNNRIMYMMQFGRNE